MNFFRNIAIGLMACLGVSLFSGCAPESSDPVPTGEEVIIPDNNGIGSGNEIVGCRNLEGNSTVEIAGIDVDVQIPREKYVGDVLILHAWDDQRSTWCAKGRLCRKALRMGYRLIMPDMGKSVYAKQYYPETRKDWRSNPTSGWMIDTLIPQLRASHCLLKEGGQNFVVGVSSGARGAIRLSQDLPELFVAVAALSGDYDPSLMKGDNIYRGFLGEFKTHSERWRETENLTRSISTMRAPVYLGHGKKDDLVPYEQTENLYNYLRHGRPNLKVQLNLAPHREHGYGYWNYEVSNVLRFFESVQANRPESPN